MTRAGGVFKIKQVMETRGAKNRKGASADGVGAGGRKKRRSGMIRKLAACGWNSAAGKR